MVAEVLSEFKVFDVRCKDALEEEGVRFCGLVDKDGNLIAGGFKPGIDRLEKDGEKFRKFLVRVLEISLRKENDLSLGKLNYVSCRRDKVVLISFPFPVSNHILLISAEPKVNLEKLAQRIAKIFGGSNLFSAWEMEPAS